MDRTTGDAVARPELVVGLVSPLGTALDPVVNSIGEALQLVGYGSQEIKLSTLLEGLTGLDSALETFPEEERYRTHMDAGDELRRKLGHDAMARLAISRLRELRRDVEREDSPPTTPYLLVQFSTATSVEEISALPGFMEFVHEGERETRFTIHDGLRHVVASVSQHEIVHLQVEPPPLDASNDPISQHAWILRSLKHPAEVALLRQTYGSRFLLFGVVSPKQVRAERLSERLSQSRADFDNERYMSEAYGLIRRDEDDLTRPYGQKTREAFWKADFVLAGADRPQDAGEQTQRIFRLFFGDPFVTPTKAEWVSCMPQPQRGGPPQWAGKSVPRSCATMEAWWALAATKSQSHLAVNTGMGTIPITVTTNRVRTSATTCATDC